MITHLYGKDMLPWSTKWRSAVLENRMPYSAALVEEGCWEESLLVAERLGGMMVSINAPSSA